MTKNPLQKMTKNPFQKMTKNPFQKILPRKEDDGETNTEGERKALLERLMPTKSKRGDMTLSQEINLGEHDAVRVWDVKMPPIKSDMVNGKLVPTVGGALGGKLRQKTSRITMEVHTNKDDPEKGSSKGGPAVMEGLLRGTSMKHLDNEVLHDEEYIILRIFRRAEANKRGGLFGLGKKGGEDDDKGEDEDDADDHSISSISLSGVDKEFHDGMWTEAYLYSLDDIELLKHRRHTVELKMGRGNDTKLRDLNFTSEQEATTFCAILESLGKLEEGRAERRLEAFHASPNSKMRNLGSKVQLLVEIVSAVRLPVADLASTDAYVTVHLGREELHRTDQKPNTLNPVWTIESGSLFLLEKTPEEFFRSSAGLALTVYDYDAIGKDDILGRVYVLQEELLDGSGERVEYPLILDAKHKDAKGARLVLRFRQASTEDLEFMKDLASQKKKKGSVGAYANEAFVPIRSVTGSILKREKRKSKTGEKEFRVKPGPDPDRPEETTWMTEAQVNVEALKPSKSWIQVGSGALGKFYVELIGCDGLPNMDSGPLHVATGGMTDAFACMIYEDSVVNADVISDALSPRWMPWTQRAFVFNIMHPSSQLMLAILDYDAGTPLNSNDPVGRVTLDHSNMRPMTDYTMQLELVTSSLVSKRKAQGTVTVRVRIEWENERKALIRSIMPPPEIYVNVSQKRDFESSHYAIVGECDTKMFSMDTLASFVEELQAYKAVVPVLKSAAFTVLLWRGHLPVTILVPSIPPRPIDPEQPPESLPRRLLMPLTLKLPMHSMVAFIGGMLLAEDYNLFPSFLLFSVAWMLLGSMELMNSHPSPWRKKRTYWEHLQVLLFNRTFTDSIDPDERKDEVEKYLEEKKVAEEASQEEAAAEAARADKAAKDEKAAAAEDTEVSIESAKTRFGFSLNPLEPILSPVQQNLEVVVRGVRIGKSFATWEESRYNFWIINISIVAGLLLVGIPWGWLFHWVFRIMVWTFLGPWMKLVDIFLVKGRTREQLRKDAKKRLRLRYQQLVEARRWRQIQREDALKLKSMKRYCYGTYIVGVPRFKEYRFYDWPQYPSHASPHVADASPPKVSARFFGQHFEGDMIPEREMPEREVVNESSALATGDATTYGSTGHKS